MDVYILFFLFCVVEDGWYCVVVECVDLVEVLMWIWFGVEVIYWNGEFIFVVV